MIKLEMKDLISYLDEELGKRFADEQYLREELEGVLQGLVNSIRWSVLADFEISGVLTVDTLEVFKNFSSRWMKQEEVVSRLGATSGLTKEVASYALEAIQHKIEEILNHQPNVEIEHIGKVSLLGPERYIIELAEELKVHPPYGYLIPWKTNIKVIG